MYTHDISFSFAGENRALVEIIKNKLVAKGFDVFYDEDYLVDLWGTDLTESLADHYLNSKFVVLFIDDYYLKKMWTWFERQVIIEKFLSLKGKEYLLPVFLDDFTGKLPGLSGLFGFVKCRSNDTEYLVDLILKKLKNQSESGDT